MDGTTNDIQGYLVETAPGSETFYGSWGIGHGLTGEFPAARAATWRPEELDEARCFAADHEGVVVGYRMNGWAVEVVR